MPAGRHHSLALLHLPAWDTGGGAVTFQHFDSHGDSSVGPVPVDSVSLCPHDLAKAAFAQGLAQHQPGRDRQNHEGAQGLLCFPTGLPLSIQAESQHTRVHWC